MKYSRRDFIKQLSAFVFIYGTGLQSVNAAPQDEWIKRVPPGIAYCRDTSVREAYLVGLKALKKKQNSEALNKVLADANGSISGQRTEPAIAYLACMVNNASGGISSDMEGLYFQIRDSNPALFAFQKAMQMYFDCFVTHHHPELVKSCEEKLTESLIISIFYPQFSEETCHDLSRLLLGKIKHTDYRHLPNNFSTLDGALEVILKELVNLKRKAKYENDPNYDLEDPFSDYNKLNVAIWSLTWLGNVYWLMETASANEKKHARTLNRSMSRRGAIYGELYDRVERRIATGYFRVRAFKNQIYYYDKRKPVRI